MMKNYEFVVELKFNGVGENIDDCLNNGIRELDMYSVSNLFYKRGFKVKSRKRVQL